MADAAPPRERLLSAADLFYAEGIRNVGVNRVLEAAETPVMSLYRHFGSKEGLLEAALRRRDERVRAKFARGVERRSETGREKILAMFDVLFDVCADKRFRGCAFINAAIELADPEHPVSQLSVAHKDATRGMFAAYAEEAGADDPQQLATRLMLLLDGAFVAATMRGDTSAAAEARAVAAVLLDATLPA